MDRLGLGLENFNALGMFRHDHGQPIDTGGQLITGGAQERAGLKHILKESRRRTYYCMTEVLDPRPGRGPEYFDVEAIDRIVEQMERDEGRFSTLLMGVIESAPFQKRRTSAGKTEPAQPKPAPKTKKTGASPGLSLTAATRSDVNVETSVIMDLAKDLRRGIFPRCHVSSLPGIGLLIRC